MLYTWDLLEQLMSEQLPVDNEGCQPANSGYNVEAPTSRQVLRVALNLKYLVDKVVPVTYGCDEIESDHSSVVTPAVVQLALEACGGDPEDKKNRDKYRAVVVFALLKVYGWYGQLAATELHNAELYESRGVAAQQLCKIIIDQEEMNDLHFMFMQMLLRRYTINENDEDSEPANAIELASDMHCTIVIGSGGFQRCLTWLWRGWIIQNRRDPTTFIRDETVSSPYFIDHFNPDRIKTPKYQNLLNIFFSILFLVLYTVVVNGKNSVTVSPIDLPELFFYLFTLGNILEEMTKMYYIGAAYFSFWSSFNLTMYSIISVSFVLRILSVAPLKLHNPSEYWDKISYRILSCAAPFVWSRMLLYLESEPFVGVMLVVLKHMMKESAVFFVLLVLIMVGFCQGFLGLDSADGHREITGTIMENLTIAVLGLGSFDKFKRFAPPYAEILYYSYYFIVSVILLNILIALYANAYQRVVDNAADEYMALMVQKTLRFIRAPDEDVFVAPLNLIELLFSPVFAFLSKTKKSQLSYYVMMVIYSPTLVLVALSEVRTSKRIKYNRLKNLPDDANEVDTAWDLTDGYVDEEDTLFTRSHTSGIRATNKKNKFSLQVQREAEAKDPKFSVPREWYSKVKHVCHKHEQEKGASDDDSNDLSEKVSELLVKLSKVGLSVNSSGSSTLPDEVFKEFKTDVEKLGNMIQELNDLKRELKDISEMKSLLKEIVNQKK